MQVPVPVQTMNTEPTFTLNKKNNELEMAQSIINDFSASKSITTDELDKRIGMNHDSLVEWVSLFSSDTEQSRDVILERLGYISNIATINTEYDATTPELANKQNNVPDLEIASSDMSREYQQDPNAADSKYRGHYIKISGLLVNTSPNSNPSNLPRNNPPRISFWRGFLNGVVNGKLNESSISFASSSKYDLSELDNRYFSNIKIGNIATLVCIVAGVDNGRTMTMPKLEGCSISK